MKLSIWLAVSEFTLILSTSFGAIQTTTTDCFFNTQTNETWKVLWADNFDTNTLSRNWSIRHETNFCSGKRSPSSLALNHRFNSIDYNTHRKWSKNGQLQHESN